MSRRAPSRNKSSGTPSSGDSFEHRVPPSRRGGRPSKEFSDDGNFAFIKPSEAGPSNSFGGGSNEKKRLPLKSSSARRTAAVALGQPAPLKSAALRRRDQQYAPKLGPLDQARELQRQNGRDYNTSKKSTLHIPPLELTSTTSSTRSRRPASDPLQNRKRIGIPNKNRNEERQSQSPNGERPRIYNNKSAGIANNLVDGILEGSGVTWGDAAATATTSSKADYCSREYTQEDTRRNSMNSIHDRIPRKTRSFSSSDEVVNVCASADEETETEEEGTPDVRLKKKKKKKKNKKKSTRPSQRSIQPRQQETILIDGSDDDVDKADKKPPPKSELNWKIPSLATFAQSDVRKDMGQIIGKPKSRPNRERFQNRKTMDDVVDPECSVVEKPMHTRQATRQRGTADQKSAPKQKQEQQQENHGQLFQRSNVCRLSDSENDMSQSMMLTDDNNNNNNDDSDQALADDLSELHMQNNRDGSTGKKRKRKRKDEAKLGLFDDASEDGGGNRKDHDSDVELVDKPQKHQAEGNVQEAISNIEQGDVFVPNTLKLSKAHDTSETQGINSGEPARKTSPFRRQLEMVKRTGKAFMDSASKMGASLLPNRSTRKKSNGKKEATRINPGEAVFAYHRDMQQQEEDEKDERERKKARKHKSSDTRKKEATCSSDEKENETFLPTGPFPRRRSSRLRSTPRKSYCNWGWHDSDEAYEGYEDLDITETSQKQKRRSKKPEVIELEDSDDEKGVQPIAAVTGFDLSRIAIGSMVFDHNCKIAWVDDDNLELSYTRSSRTKNTKRKTFSHIINFEKEVTLVKYFVPTDENDAADDSDKASGDDDTDQTCFVAFCVTKSGANRLMSISNKYKPDADDNDDGRKYILAEFRSDVAWQDFYESIPALVGPFFAGGQLSASQTSVYTKSLAEDSKKQVNSSQRNPGTSGRTGSLAEMNEHDVLVVYPFGAKPSDIEATSVGLCELSGASLVGNGRKNEVIGPAKTCSEAESGGDSSDGNEENKRSRAHYLTVRIGDYDRLEAGEFLNDTLIDFFLQWMIRHDDRSSIHVFSSHFYSTLLDEGPKGVVKWTKNKGIDIFSRKLVFIPINRNLHWSLCVVINPGHIKVLRERDNEDRSCQPLPCLLFLDSLRAHQKTQVRRKVTSWLNSEWERLGKDPELKTPFKAMKIMSPLVPYQDNTWDCGVFACRYAYAVYQLRDRVFSFDEMQLVHGEIDMITNGPEFDFGMEDIARIRLEMKTWLENLHRVYKDWRKSADEAEAKEKADKRRARLQPQQTQESQDSSTVEVVDKKKVQPLNNENDGGGGGNHDDDDDKEDPKASDEGTHTHWEMATPTEVQDMEIDAPELCLGNLVNEQKCDVDSSDDEEATKRSSQASQQVHDLLPNLSESVFLADERDDV